jgi:hypothetical protein
MLSRASVRPDLRFPGFFGALIGESIRIFEEITRRKDTLTRKGFMEGLDRLLETLSAGEEQSGTEMSRTVPSMTKIAGTEPSYGKNQGETPPPRPERRRAGTILLAAAVLLILGLTAAGFTRA